MRALLNALAPLIGAEAELGKAVSPGWADNVSDDKIAEWRAKGTDMVKNEMETLAQEICATEYGKLMHKVIISPLSHTFRTLLMNENYSVWLCVD